MAKKKSPHGLLAKFIQSLEMDKLITQALVGAIQRMSEGEAKKLLKSIRKKPKKKKCKGNDFGATV